jgi:hypothetical protein
MELKKQNVILTFEKSKESIKLTLVTVNISCGCLFTLRMLSTVVCYPPWNSCWFFFTIPLGKFFCILFQAGTSLMYQAKKKKKKTWSSSPRLSPCELNCPKNAAQTAGHDLERNPLRENQIFFLCIFYFIL